jgi:hypothetical protein
VLGRTRGGARGAARLPGLAGGTRLGGGGLGGRLGDGSLGDLGRGIRDGRLDRVVGLLGLCRLNGLGHSRRGLDGVGLRRDRSF